MKVGIKFKAKTIDPSHILTNLRLHATQKGFFKCDPQAVNECPLQTTTSWEELYQKFQFQITKVYHLHIKFSVIKLKIKWWQMVTTKKQNLCTKYAIGLMACNQHGIPLQKQLKYFVEINNYLFRFYDPQHFPVSLMHICGLPSTTFQGILQNISTRIQLYRLSQNNTYNQQSVSTLAVESFFSDLSIPMAANLPRYLAWMSQLNKIKDDPTK